jgi:hypothetical protein
MEKKNVEVYFTEGGEGAWAGLIWLKRGNVTDFCKYGDAFSVAIKSRTFFSLAEDYRPIKKG